jgi:hypothetical protein
MMGKKRKVQKFNEICEIDVLNHVKKVGGGWKYLKYLRYSKIHGRDFWIFFINALQNFSYLSNNCKTFNDPILLELFHLLTSFIHFFLNWELNRQSNNN